MNKPVAWMDTFGDIEKFNHNNNKDWIPLYTHPVKELTDEEILEIAYLRSIFYEHEIIDFAKAILRKAQEK